MNRIDYLPIGSNGFAQVGDPNYIAKNKVEMQVLLNYFLEHFPIPENLQNIAIRYKINRFPHEFGSYHELVLLYDYVTLDALDNSNDETHSNLVDEFWDWFNKVESADLESQEITDKIQALYFESVKPNNIINLPISNNLKNSNNHAI